MSNWQIELDNVGRGNITQKIQITAPTLPMAEGEALRRCKRFMVSKNVYLSHRDNLTYSVCDGMHIVGEVRIRSL